MQIHLVWDCPFCILRGNRLKFINYDAFLSLMIVFILANSADYDEMWHYVPFHLGLNWLSKYLITKGKWLNPLYSGNP